jgi:lipopolysaccharide export system permease protein
MLGRLGRYVLRDFAGLFGMALLLVTFAMCLGAIYKAIDVLSRGIDVGTVLTFFLNNIPYTLSYSIPISVLFATLLLFGRLSADGELSAMKSGGLSLWQIASPLVLMALGLSVFCLVNNTLIYPKTQYANRALLKNMGVEDPVKLLDEGRFIRDFPGYMIYVGKKEGSQIEDLVFYEISDEGGEIERSIRAKTGTLSHREGEPFLEVMLQSVRIEIPDSEHPDDAAKTHYLAADQFPIQLDISSMSKRETVSKKRRNMTLVELIYQLHHVGDVLGVDGVQAAQERCRWRVHLHQRFYLALAPLTFVLVGIPLGIRSHRRESAAGMVLSLTVMFVYYLLMIVADGLDTKPHWYPWLIPWIGTIISQLGGLWLIRKLN